jgi:hypothetical protein
MGLKNSDDVGISVHSVESNMHLATIGDTIAGGLQSDPLSPGKGEPCWWVIPDTQVEDDRSSVTGRFLP